MPFPYIFTFYSYKGGVGRSMAVLNVAYRLAGWGRHVLVVDMDLEAPGLSGFLQRNNELAEPETAHPKDVLTLLVEATSAARSDGDMEAMAKSLPSVSNYIRPVAAEKLTPLQPKLGQLGRLDVLGTDLERDYLGRQAQLGLKELPQDQLLSLSRLLHHYFKAQTFPHRPLGIESFEPPISTHYDYVLVDSRTGITEIGGLCVGPLADRLVVVTGLNDQNVEGTLAFLKEVGIQPTPRPKGDQPWDDADAVSVEGTESPSLGPKPTILVASPVPFGEISYKRERLGYLEKRVGIRPISLSYHPQMALMESFFVRDYREEQLAGEYGRLTEIVMKQVQDDPKSLAAVLGLAWNEKKDVANATAQALRIASNIPELGLNFLMLLREFISKLNGNHLPEARQISAALSRSPETMVDALNRSGIALAEQAATKTGQEATWFLEEAGRKYSEALLLDSANPTTLANFGALLATWAMTTAGEEADRLLDEAERKFADALRVRPGDHQALSNWGVAQSYRAKIKPEKEADRLFDDAARKFAEALQLKPDSYQAHLNWGNALFFQANAKAGREALELLEKARSEYIEALRIKPDLPDAFSNLGNVLSTQAKQLTGDPADNLYTEARRQYAEAVRIKPDFHEALQNWGLVLFDQSKRKTGNEADRLLHEAREKYLSAERIRPGVAAYNLACLEAHLGNSSEAIHWAQFCASAGASIPKDRISADSDFDRIRNDPEFVSFLESLAPSEQPQS